MRVVRGQRRIGHSNAAIARMEAATQMYYDAKSRSECPFNGFGTEPTHILIALANHPRNIRFDSHNQIKPICDWLQKIGVIDDDYDAEAACFRKADYGQSPRTTTTIIVQLRKNIQVINETYFKAISSKAGY